jgi:hypothetical protein
MTRVKHRRARCGCLRRPRRTQPYLEYYRVPADGVSAASIGNGNFGTSPFWGSASSKPLLACACAGGGCRRQRTIGIEQLNRQRTAGSCLIQRLRVILVIVKEAGHPSLQRVCLLRITDGAGAVEEFPLELRGDSIPMHDLQNFFFLSEGGTFIATLSAPTRPIDIDLHPFLVFGKVCARQGWRGRLTGLK